MFFDNKKRTARLSDSSCTVVTKTVHHCDRSKNDHSINNIVKLTGIPQNNIDYEMIYSQLRSIIKFPKRILLVQMQLVTLRLSWKFNL